MTPDQLAEIGLSRIQLPIPMAKLQIIHGAARALCNSDTDKVMWRVILRWIESLDFESEVLEALCILFVARGSHVLSSSELRRSIRNPSILSDHFIALVFDLPVLMRTWEKSHSGEVPPLYRLDSIQKELDEGRIVPPILSTQLRELERRVGKPFMRQWAYEFDRLQQRLGSQQNGHFSYFSGNQGQDATGHFIGRRGHLARSAYLRVFALAVDLWNMPYDFALDHAMKATPADFSFLKMLPSDPPEWAQSVNPEEAFRFHEFLPGHVYIPRDEEGNFHIPPWPLEDTLPSKTGAILRPVLLPAVASEVGYLHSDLIERMPYLPVAHAPGASLIATPCIGGAEIKLNSETVGVFRYWNCAWQPMHQKNIGSHGAVAVTLSEKYSTCIPGPLLNKVIRCWRAKVRIRAKEYGEWEDHTFFGRIN